MTFYQKYVILLLAYTLYRKKWFDMSRINKFGEILRDVNETKKLEDVSYEDIPVFTPPNPSNKDKEKLSTKKPNISQVGEKTKKCADTMRDKLKISYAKEGDKILNTGKFEYHGTKYDLATLANLTERLSSEMIIGTDEVEYSTEILTIAMQMRRKALETILQDTQVTPQKEQELQALIDMQSSLNQQGLILSSSQMAREAKDSQLAQLYITALNEEIKKQIEIDIKKSKELTRQATDKLPKISSGR